jgi:hypothetical protein
MIKLYGIGKQASRSKQRRRIANQLAAFAAIMLFASTQVAGPENSVHESESAATAVMLDSEMVGEFNEHQDDPPDSDAGKSAEAVALQTVSSAAPKRRGLKLNLFLFRR